MKCNNLIIALFIYLVSSCVALHLFKNFRKRYYRCKNKTGFLQRLDFLPFFLFSSLVSEFLAIFPVFITGFRAAENEC